MPLHTDFRPTNLDEIIGNQDTVSSLKIHLTKSRPNRSILFIGPSGCGKTTLAFCTAYSVMDASCPEDGLGNFTVLNASDFRGIDTVREVREAAQRNPLGKARARVWLWDECFSGNTPVQTISGQVPIRSIKPGDLVFCINGPAKVKSVFTNRVALNRVVKLTFTNKKTLYTTIDHEFLMEKGWVKATDLKNHFTFSFNPIIMPSIKLGKELKSEDMRMVWGRVSQPWREIENLFSIMQISAIKLRTWIRKKFRAYLHGMREYFYSKRFKPKELLQYSMREYLCWKKQDWSDCIQGNQTAYFLRTFIPEIQKPRSIRSSNSIQVREDARGFQSIEESKNYRKNEAYKTNKWDSPYMEWGERRKWKAHPTSNPFSFYSWLENRIFSSYQYSQRIGTGNKLQIRHSLSGTEDRNRSRWEWTQQERDFFIRSKENKGSNRVGLESIEVYKPGSNDESFSGIIGNQECNQGFVEFYDLEIEGHPSYFAEGLPVHNCHKISPDGQEAMLKLLEDPPRNCWFLLATTNPEKLKVTLKRRCTEYQVSPVSEKDIQSLLTKVIRKERKRVSQEVLQQISGDSMGSCGMALNMLDKIIDLPAEDMAKAAKRWAERSSNVMFLGKTLLDLHRKGGAGKKGAWSKVLCPIIRELEDEDQETVRRQCYEYLRKVFISGDESVYKLMACFSYPYYDVGKGLAASVYEAFCAE